MIPQFFITIISWDYLNLSGKWIHWWHHNTVIMSLQADQAIRLQYSHQINLLFDKLFHVFLISYLENISLKYLNTAGILNSVNLSRVFCKNSIEYALYNSPCNGFDLHPNEYVYKSHAILMMRETLLHNAL